MTPPPPQTHITCTPPSHHLHPMQPTDPKYWGGTYNAPCIFQHPVIDSSILVENGDAPQGGSTDVSHRALVSALHCLILSLIKTDPELSADTKDKIALQFLPDAHHPAICKSFFYNFLQFLVHDFATLHTILFPLDGGQYNVDIFLKTLSSFLTGQSKCVNCERECHQASYPLL